MDQKKYQVFVSSTYKDLQKERREVMQVLLEMGYIPSGMELFPAANEDQWSLIKGVIDDCDYYVVIIAGCYGSQNSEGVSYTEKEYSYAFESGKPVIAFLHKAPEKLSIQHTESTDSGKEKLIDFRKRVEKQRTCKYWSTPHELGSVVVRSLTQLSKKHPGIGWVRGDQIPEAGLAEEILQLRKKIERLEGELQRVRIQPPSGTEHFAKGEDIFEIKFHAVYSNGPLIKTAESKTVSSNWNEIISTISPLLIQEANEGTIKTTLIQRFKSKLPNSKEVKDILSVTSKTILELSNLEIDAESFGTIIVQLRALGIIMESDRSHSVKDTATYWKLTPYGNHTMNNLRAIRRSH